MCSKKCGVKTQYGCVRKRDRQTDRRAGRQLDREGERERERERERGGGGCWVLGGAGEDT